MLPMKSKEFIRLIENAGFIMIRSSKHLIYRRHDQVLVIPHSKMVSPGVIRQFFYFENQTVMVKAV